MTQPVQINVYNTRGDIVAAHPPRSLKLVDTTRGAETYFLRETLHYSTMLPAVRQLQYEMLQIWAEKIGRHDLCPSVDGLLYDVEGYDGGQEQEEHGYYEMKIPLGRVRTVREFSRGRRSMSCCVRCRDVDAHLTIRTTCSLAWDVSIHFVGQDLSETSFRFHRGAHWGSSGSLPCSIDLRSNPAFRHELNRSLEFETEEEYETAMTLVSALQEFLAEDDSSILEELLRRCPQYESTHTILRAPLRRGSHYVPLFAYVLDMGADSVEITNETTLSELIDIVNSEAYRTYHGLEAGSSEGRLLFELYVSLLPQPEAEIV